MSVKCHISAILYDLQVCKFRPQILQPGQNSILLEIAVSQGATIYPDLKLESVMLIYTNISTLSVPLLCYNGKLVKVKCNYNTSQWHVLHTHTPVSYTHLDVYKRQVIFFIVYLN